MKKINRALRFDQRKRIRIPEEPLSPALDKVDDDCAGRPITEYAGLRPKMYSILEASGENIKKATGVLLLGS
ncbi:MAG: hypothetical protein ABW185_16180 [Sedimenticola sp.]